MKLAVVGFHLTLLPHHHHNTGTINSACMLPALTSEAFVQLKVLHLLHVRVSYLSYLYTSQNALVILAQRLDRFLRCGQI